MASATAAYRAMIARCNAIVAGADLETQALVRRPDGVAPTLRWILVHMIEETSRHAGHADIIREQIDGVVGR